MGRPGAWTHPWRPVGGWASACMPAVAVVAAYPVVVLTRWWRLGGWWKRIPPRARRPPPVLVTPHPSGRSTWMGRGPAQGWHTSSSRERYFLRFFFLKYSIISHHVTQVSLQSIFQCTYGLPSHWWRSPATDWVGGQRRSSSEARASSHHPQWSTRARLPGGETFPVMELTR